MTLLDIEKKVSDLFNQGYSAAKNVYHSLPQPIQQSVPQAASFLFDSQPWRQQIPVNIPKISIPQVNIKSPVPNFLVNQVAKPFAEGLANIPGNAIRSSNQLNRDYGLTHIAPPKQLAKDVVNSALTALDISTFGGSTVPLKIGKQALEQGGKVAFKQALKKGALEGATYGGLYGGLQGASQGKNFDLANIVKSGVGGAVIGSLIGGGSATVGNLASLLKRSPDVEAELLTRASNQPRDPRTGQWATNNLVKPKGMSTSAWKFQLKFNKKYGRNPYTIVTAEDLKKAIEYEAGKHGPGLSIRDINKDKNPLNQGASYQNTNTPTQAGGIPQAELPKVPGASQLRQGIQSEKSLQSSIPSNNRTGTNTLLPKQNEGLSTQSPQIQESGLNNTGQSGSSNVENIGTLNQTKLKLKGTQTIPATNQVSEGSSLNTSVQQPSKRLSPNGISTNPPSDVNIPQGQKERQFITTVREAKTTANDVANKVKGFYSPQSTDEMIARARYTVETSYDNAKARVINEPLTSETNAIGQEIMRKAQNEGRYEDAIQMAETLAKKGTQAGQAVQAFSNWARLTPEGMLKYAQKEFLDANQKMDILSKTLRNTFGKGKVKLTTEDAKVITGLMEKANNTANEAEKAAMVQQTFEYIGKKLPWGISDVLDEYRYNNMLSNPLTHVRNIWSNLLQTYITRPSTLAAQGKLSDAAKYEVGVTKALPDAFSNFYKAFKSGSPLGKFDEEGISRMRPIKPNRIGWLNIPSRALEGADQFFSTLIKSGEQAAGATEAQAQKTAEYTLFRQGLSPEGQGHVLNAIDNVTRASYGLRRVGLGWFIPFIRTPMNVAKQWIEYSPAGLATIPGSVNKKEQIAKAALGSVATAIGASLAMEGRTTWAAPTDKKQKQLFYDSGRKPYSIKIGDKWVPMQTLGVFAWAVGIPAAAKYYQDQSRTALTDSQIQKLTNIAFSGLGFWSQQTFVSGLGSFVNLAQGNTDYTLAKNLAYTVGQLKPWDGLMRYVANAIDPIYRNPKGFMQQLQADVPILTKGLPAFETSLGNPSKRLPINNFLPYGVGQSNSSFEEPYQLRTQKLQQNAVLNKMKNDLTQGSAIDKASAAETTPVNAAQAKFKDDLAKQRLEVQGGYTTLSDGSIAYQTPKGTVATLDLTPPTKGTGIGSIANTDWKATKAVSIWNNPDIPQELKTKALQKLNVNPEDARYAALASYSSDVSAQYITSKSPDHDTLLKNIVSGRVVGITGKQFASNDVLDTLYEQGQISAQERTALKKIKLNKKGESLTKTSSGGGRKPRGVTISKVSPVRISLSPFKKRSRSVIKIRKAPSITLKRRRNKTLSIPQSARSYSIKAPEKIKGLTNSIRLV